MEKEVDFASKICARMEYRLRCMGGFGEVAVPCRLRLLCRTVSQKSHAQTKRESHSEEYSKLIFACHPSSTLQFAQLWHFGHIMDTNSAVSAGL